MGVVYLAGRYSRRLELCAYRDDLERRGHDVPARWLKGNHQVEGLTAENEDSYTLPADLATEYALDDLEDIVQSDALVAFTEAPRVGPTRGGRHWEMGFACGIRYARWPLSYEPQIYLVGPLENVFTALPIRNTRHADPHALLDGRYENWSEFLAALDSGAVTL